MGSSDHVTELALRAGRGDRAALTEFIKATQSDVWRLLAHLGGTDRADDLTQETYLRVMGALPRFAARSSAMTWLLSLARRVWADSMRYDRARPRKSAAEVESVAALRVPESKLVGVGGCAHAYRRPPGRASRSSYFDAGVGVQL